MRISDWSSDVCSSDLKVYADAQLRLLSAVEQLAGTVAPADVRLGFVRTIDQAISAFHPANLRYPPRILAQALTFTLTGLPAEGAARRAWKSSVPGQAFAAAGLTTL